MAELVDGESVDFSSLPAFCRELVERYVNGGIDPGTGWRLILAHDVFAVLACDDQTVEALPKILRWVHNRAPSACHGSKEKVARWCVRKRAMRRVEAFR